MNVFYISEEELRYTTFKQAGWYNGNLGPFKTKKEAEASSSK